jgi:ribosomal protein S8E
MFKNYFKTAFRNLVKNKFSAFLNIAGLAVGMAVALLIGLWVWDELSFDKYHENYDSLARVMQQQTFNGEINTLKAMPIPAATELRQSYGEAFKYIVLASWTNLHNVSFQDKNILMKGTFMEPDAPQMLTLKMIYGTRDGLTDPTSVLLSGSASKAIFGTTNPLGKVLKLDSVNLNVAGVYEDLPLNTSFNELSFIAPWNVYANTADVKAREDWNQTLSSSLPK